MLQANQSQHDTAVILLDRETGDFHGVKRLSPYTDDPSKVRVMPFAPGETTFVRMPASTVSPKLPRGFDLDTMCKDRSTVHHMTSPPIWRMLDLWSPSYKL